MDVLYSHFRVKHRRTADVSNRLKKSVISAPRGVLYILNPYRQGQHYSNTSGERVRKKKISHPVLKYIDNNISGTFCY